MVKREAEDIVVAGVGGGGEASCPYCVLLHAKGAHNIGPSPSDDHTSILHHLEVDL